VIPTIAPYLLPAVAPALRRRLPAPLLSWTEEKTPDLVEKLEAGELDGALLALEARLGDDLEHAVIAIDRFLLAMARRHPLARAKRPALIDDLAGAEVLLLDDGHCLRDQALAFCSRAGAREREFRATSLTTLVQMVAAGTAVTLLPSWPPRPRGAGARSRCGRSRARRRAGRSPLLAPVDAARACLQAVAEAVREAYPTARLRR